MRAWGGLGSLGVVRRSAAAVALWLCLEPREAHAGSDPDIDWWTIRTPHFRIHYWKSLEPLAERVASLCEDVHDRIAAPLGYAAPSTEIVLTDDSENANGSAINTPFNTVRLYATAPDDLSTLGDHDDWMLGLVTHEYTHILHTDNISGAASVINAVLGKTLAPNQLQPRWVLEGLATAFESAYTSGGRVRSSLFDAYLRADYLDDSFVGLDQLSSSPMRWPQGNVWYLYGSRFLAWIAEIYGQDVLRAVSTDYGSWPVPLGINRAIRRQTGRTYEELYVGFLDHVRRRYAAQLNEVERRGLREGTRLTHHGREVSHPRAVPASSLWGEGCDQAPSPERERACPSNQILYFRNDFHERSGLYRLALGPDGAVLADDLVARTSGSSTGSFAPDGSLFFHSTSVWKNVYYRHDLFRVPARARATQGWESHRDRLTEGLRAQYADVHPRGTHVVFTVNSKGTTYLEIATWKDGVLGAPRELVPSARFEQAYTPRFSPDGTKVAYSAWTKGGYRDVRIVDVATGSFREIAHDRALDLEPVWSPDGATLYFASDRTGIFNIYAYDVATAELHQVTNVKTLAVMPAVSHDGRSLTYVGYTSKGYDLFRIPLEKARLLPALAAPTDRPDPPSEPLSRPKLDKRPYDPLPTLAPRTWFAGLAPGRYSGNAVTLSTRGADVTGQHSFSASTTIDPGAPQPDFSMDYAYGRFQPDLVLRGFVTSAPRKGYVVKDVDTPYVERSVGLTVGVSLPIRQEFSSHRLGLSYSFAYYQPDLPKGTLDPNATPPRPPSDGTLGSVRASYSFSASEGSFDAAGNSARGFDFDLAVDFADTITGSPSSLYSVQGSATGYTALPWGKHVLALRAGGGTAAGTYARGGAFSTGGYDLKTNDLFRTLTTGALNGAVALRGYAPRAFVGRSYLLLNAEYRAPLYQPDRGISTLPVYLRRIDAAGFVDVGGAFDKLDLSDVTFFSKGAFLDPAVLHASAGLELWLGVTVAYVWNAQLRLGYAQGFDSLALRDGKTYFVASTAF